ncbi:MAG: ankyrin repeat domain-containing protein [Pyrinomonadaceae bacterium]
MDKRSFIDLVRGWQAIKVQKALAVKPSFAIMVEASGMTPLHHCAKVNLKKSGRPAGDAIKTAQALLDTGANVNHVRLIPDDGELFHATPLWYAVAWGQNPKLARFLLANGSDSNHCLFASSWAQDLELTRLLLDHGAEVDPVAFGETPLLGILKVHRAAVAPLLIERGADINYCDPQGFTALHHAVKKKFTLKQIRELLDLGADPKVKNAAGETADEMARRLGQMGAAKLLTQG